MVGEVAPVMLRMTVCADAASMVPCVGGRLATFVPTGTSFASDIGTLSRWHRAKERRFVQVDNGRG